MKVNLYATFRILADRKHIDLNVPEGITLRKAVDAIVADCPSLREHWLDKHGAVHAHVHAFVNGAEVLTLPLGWETPLTASDELDFFPPVAGGCYSLILSVTCV